MFICLDVAARELFTLSGLAADITLPSYLYFTLPVALLLQLVSSPIDLQIHAAAAA